MVRRSQIDDVPIINIADLLEKFGKYQIFQYVYVCFTILLVSIINVNYIFVAGDVRYRCRIPECDSLSSNYTVPWWPNHTDQCTKPILNESHIHFVGVCKNSSFIGITEKCTDWIYENHDTIISEFNLACQPWKKNMVGTVHNIGMAFAMFMGGWMADNLGRKTTLLICTLGCLVGNFKTLALNYTLYLSVEFLEAAISGGIYTAAAVLMLEIAGNNKRVLAGVIYSYAIYMGEAVFALIGMAIPYWKTLIYVINSPAIIFLSFIILGNESPRWLIVKGKVSQAKETIKEIATINKINLDKEEFKNIDKEKLKALFNLCDTVTKQGILQSFRCKELVIRFLVASFGKFTAGFVYYGLLVNSVVLPGDKNTNFLLAAIMSFPGEFISMFLMNNIGRKLTLMIGYLLCGLLSITSGFASETWLKVSLFLLGKLVTSVCYTGIITYTVELFPTSVRGSLIGLCALSSALGSMLAPLTPALSPVLASLIFGATGVIASGLLYFTPETKDLPLFDTIEQVVDSIEKEKKKNYNNSDHNTIYADQTGGTV